MRSLTGLIRNPSLAVIALIVVMTSGSIASTYIFAAGPSPQSGESTWKDIALFVSPLLPAIVGIVALFISMRNVKMQIKSSDSNADAQRWRDANFSEMEKLETLLRTFHVPYLVRAEANSNMAQDLRDRFGDPNYRLLIKLFDPTWLPSLAAGDRALVDEVCQNGLELRKFIEDNSGGVDSILADHLARASTHFRILSLAHDGKLGTDPNPFRRYVYPRQLDLAIEADRNRILQRLGQLRAAPSKNNGIIEPLNLPEDAKLEPWPNPIRGTS